MKYAQTGFTFALQNPQSHPLDRIFHILDMGYQRLVQIRCLTTFRNSASLCVNGLKRTLIFKHR
ncbi:hypothetical protein TMatcc_010861 [Talaromyces marneffei ATCC 18224]